MRMSASWHDQLRSESTTERTPEQVAEYIWQCCHDTLQVSYSRGAVPHIPYEAQKTWECLGMQLLREVYCVDNLHHAHSLPSSVNPVEDKRIRPRIDEIYSGADMIVKDDEEDFLYMHPKAPAATLAGDILGDTQGSHP
ncbi:hypothetical protein, variant [Exophiala xenobiotica]|uniref:Uncharacterized protein n=1 Tax=Exophiala xenobiotica TaxID=348802 RepID=A0A0D2C981_9EURO|nr:hypothetical protein, variant [Exophiala xenobiotica]XP_013322075.1 uncharacterized protein PV05_01608 [Exophiala xenobiotica]KIW61490.1 hypothetical protein PV05_01608 [Exophiala xenobiotica]KIW61491.1 hypothetical protein, variant [Exophiala xenobiotica]